MLIAGEYASTFEVPTSLHVKIMDVVLYETIRIIIGYLKLPPIEKIQLLNTILPTDIQRKVAAAIEKYKHENNKWHTLYKYDFQGDV